MKRYLSNAIDFLNSIGLKTTVVEGASGFVPHCRINEGALEVDHHCPVSDLLHEAGHLAPCPAQYRHLFSGNVGRGQKALMNAVSGFSLPPDHSLSRAALQTGEPEATAWSWCAGLYLGVPTELIILDSDFNGDGEVERLRLLANSHYGIQGLQHAGFCRAKESAPRKDLPVFPSLAFWLQPAIDPCAEPIYG